MNVFVYRNLHKPGHTYSIRALDGEHKNLVIGHTSELQLTNVKLVVREKGRQRVIREKRKNVHAGLVGTLVWVGSDYTQRRPITPPSSKVELRSTGVVKYNPYLNQTFVTADGRPILEADVVQVTGARIVAT